MSYEVYEVPTDARTGRLSGRRVRGRDVAIAGYVPALER